MIIVVFGLPGSGKSYFARHLADKLSARYLSSDKLRNEILASKSYSDQEKLQIYDLMMSECSVLVSQGKDIILDATFYKDALRQKIIDLARELSCRIEFIEVWADENIVKERVSKKREESDADFNVYLRIQSEFESIEIAHLKLQSTQSNIDAMINKALAYLNRKT